MSGRYEKKFYYDSINYYRIRSKVISNNLGFFEVHPERLVNSIYLDDNNFSSYSDSVEGAKNRKKFRFRWYGNNCKQANLNLEIKEKKAEIGTKKIIPLGTINLEEKLNIQKKISNSKLIDFDYKNSFAKLMPVLLCSYKREYFLSANKLIRLTIDREISYSNFSYSDSLYRKKLLKYSKIVIEIKYEKSFDIKEIFNSDLGETQCSRFSKYTNGIDLIYF